MAIKIHEDLEHVLITEEELREAVSRLGAQISKDYRNKKLKLISVLKGSVIFLADLARCIDTSLEMDFMAVSSYNSGVKTSGVVRIIKDLDKPIEGNDILIVEDILDSGMTLRYLLDMLRERGPASIKIATLLDKPDRRQTDVQSDYVGFVVPDEFVVGYGLDYNEKYRNLPYVGVLSPRVYAQ